MASIARPMLLRQCAASARALQTQSTTTSASNPLAQRAVNSPLVRGSVSGALKVASFHATGRRSILPPLPQKIQGTANDPVPVPNASPIHGSYHWTAERLVSAALIPLTIAPFAGSSLNPVTDAVFGALLIAHSHIGFQACVIDYFPKGRVPGVRKGLMWLLNGMTVLTLVGLYEFETNDVGITEAVKRVWKA